MAEKHARVEIRYGTDDADPGVLGGVVEDRMGRGLHAADESLGPCLLCLARGVLGVRVESDGHGGGDEREERGRGRDT